MLIIRQLSRMLSSLGKKIKTLNEIDIISTRILDNYRHVLELNSYAEIWPVVKSNAYGHGIPQIASILSKTLFTYAVVDSYYEALQYWEADSRRHVLIMGYTHPDTLSVLPFHRLAIVVYDRITIETLAKTRRKVRVHLKINTGMNRQGIQLHDLRNFLEIIGRYDDSIILEGLCTHFADADGENEHYTCKQDGMFQEALRIVSSVNGRLPRFVHTANTAASTKIVRKEYNAVRLGFGLYGFNPLHPSDPFYNNLQALKPCLRFRSTLVNINVLSPGETVSYGCTYRAKWPMRIGVIPAGYYEVFDRRLSNKGYVRYRDRYLPIVGRVCMNLTMVDLMDTCANVGDEIELITPEHDAPSSIMGMQRHADIFPYEALVRLASTTRRRIIATPDIAEPN